MSRAHGLVLLLTFVSLLASFMYTGTFARYVADDFCTAGTALQQGLVGAQAWWYLNWSGRFSFIFLIDILNLLGPWTVPVTPMVLLLSWSGLTAVAAYPFLVPVAGARSRWLAALLGVALPGMTLATSPAPWESIYWQTGSITYLLPIVLGTGYVVTIWQAVRASHRSRSASPWLVLGAVLIVLAVGCSETALGLVVAALGAAVAGVLVLSRGAHRSLLLKATGIALAGALVAGVIVVLAPGNAIRSVFFERPPLVLALIEGIWYPTLACFNLLVRAPAYAIIAYAMPFWAARSTQSVAHTVSSSALVRIRRLVMLSGFVVIAGSGAPAFYIGGAAPPTRAQIIPQFVLMATIMCCGLLDGLARRSARPGLVHRWQHTALTAAGAALLILGPIWSIQQVMADSAELRPYAAALDSVDDAARTAMQAGRLEVVVQRPVHPTLVTTDDLGSDPSEFPNTCAARYYGLESITAS